MDSDKQEVHVKYKTSVESTTEATGTSPLESSPDRKVIAITSELRTSQDTMISLLKFDDDDPANPYNWPSSRKTIMTIILSLGNLISIMTTSMVAPALTDISRELSLDPAAAQLTMTIYLIAFAFGPLIIGPMSEVYGRKLTWLACNAWYIIWNSLCPVGRSEGLLFTGRLLSGFGGCVSISASSQLVGPCMTDIWRPENRGKGYALASFIPYFGIAVGPIIGGVCTQTIGWHWIFFASSIFQAIVTTLGAILVPECYAPLLLRRRARSLEEGKCIQRPDQPELSKRIRTTLFRPIHLFFTRPVIPVMSFLLAYLFGIYCIALSTFATLWTAGYHQPALVGGLHYIALAIGAVVGGQAGGRLMDYTWGHLKSRASGAVRPEYRVPLMVPGAVLMPVGLVIYGWSADYRIHWIVVDLGIAIFTVGDFMASQAMVAYMMEEFTEHAASANAATRLLSNLMGAGFPIFAPRLFDVLGYGWGNTLLAALSVVVLAPAPLLLWKHGERLRAVGRPPSPVST